MKKQLFYLIAIVLSCLLIIFTNADDNTTTVTYHVDSSYQWQIHTTIDFGSNEGVNQTIDRTAKIGNDNVGVIVTKNVIPDGDTLVISIDDEQSFTITNQNDSLNYTVSKTSGGDALSAGDNVLEVSAGTNTGSQALYFTLTTGSGTAEKAGTYMGTITYNARLTGGSIPNPNNTPYLLFTSTDPFNAYPSKFNEDGIMEYSFDGNTWYELQFDDEPIFDEYHSTTINASQEDNLYSLYIRASGCRAPRLRIKRTCEDQQISVSGNIDSLLDYTNLNNVSYDVYNDGLTDDDGDPLGALGLTFLTSEVTDASNLYFPDRELSPYCYSGMFSGCYELENLPILPSTSLAECCYMRMFYNTEYIKIPIELPATVLPEKCYSYMFGSYFNTDGYMKLSSTQEGNYQIPYRIPSSGTGIAEDDALDHMFYAEYNCGLNDNDGTPDINTTYYLYDYSLD